MGHRKLSPNASENAAILAHESGLYEVLVNLQHFEQFPSLEMSQLQFLVMLEDKLRRINAIQQAAWNDLLSRGVNANSGQIQDLRVMQSGNDERNEDTEQKNMYLCGVIPGPKKPSLKWINNFLRPLAWKGCVPCPGSSRFLSHTATLFCSFCYLPVDMIENINMESWPIHSAKQHCTHAEEWLLATSSEQQEQIARTYGVRFLELLRLPYWDPIWFTVLDSMHAFFLRVIQQHVRYIWGLSPTAPAGDGTNSPTETPPPKPSTMELLKGLNVLLQKSTGDACIESLSKKCPLLDWLQESHNNRQRVASLLQSLQAAEDNADDGLPTSGNAARPLRTQGDAPTEAELEHVQSRLRTAKINKNIGNGMWVPTLQALCHELGILTPDPKGCGMHLTKMVLVDLIGKWCIEHGLMDAQGNLLEHSVDCTNVDYREKPVVLGCAILEEVWRDQEQLVLPSFIFPAPSLLGFEKRKLSANQWHSGRQWQMLNNYMHLVTAVYIASLWSTSEELAGCYMYHFKSYLLGILELYKEARVQPVHHACLHFERLLVGLGPVHSWRTWAFEHFNYMLQRTKTNMHFVIRWCETVQLGGVIFQPAAQSQWNLHAMVQLPGLHRVIQTAAQILMLFVLKGEEDIVFAVISHYMPLSDMDAEQDPYPQFGILAGCLYYDEVKAPVVTRASHLLAPFAKTPFKLDCIVKPVIHVLPLYKDIYSYTDISHDIEADILECTK
ncbi:hypothetical protein BKA83DRAFT_4571787 [Pisolithus microcarpus]|nr:hypothetical protein BKA83DRAFT_4571787 [Pisolithus microcarpus]